VPDENPSGLGVFDLPLRLPGQYFDKETNLHYNYLRDYDPSLGRYAQSDPLGLLASLNTYSYVDSAPILIVDPLGLMGRGSGAGSGGHWADCAPADWKICNKECGDRGVKSCKVWISIHTELINGRIIRGPKKSPPSCNCNECPDPDRSPSGKRSPSGLGDDADELLGDKKRKQSNPMFGPLPIWRYLLP
jgi:RHS repeat-associated protein